MKRLNYFLLGILIALIGLLGFVASARAEYLPNQEFLAKMQKLIDLASEQDILGFHFKEVKAGQAYREGDVAYFVEAAASPETPMGDSFIQLEEWRLNAGGQMIVTYVKMWRDHAVSWTMDMSSPTKETTPEKTLDITSPEVISKMEHAQEMLLRDGKAVIIGGQAI